MRIMSFNIRCGSVADEPWYTRIDVVTKTILESGADTVGLQEATPEWMAVLKETLKEKYSFIGIGRDIGSDDPDDEDEGEYSSIFYLKDKYDVLESETFWLSETPEKVSYGWDAVCRRVCTWGVFLNKETNEKFVHFNTHFDHIGVEARRNSVEMIIKKAKEFKNIPAVFTADMNVIEGTENYNQFVNSGYFNDTKKQAPKTMHICTYHDAKPEEHKDEVIDYVMINNDFEVLEYKVLTDGIDGRFVSDHYPIYADIKIKE